MLKSADTMKKFLTELFARHGMQFNKPGAWLKVQAKGFMPLNIERIAPDVISVMHTYIQNGDVMRDPDIEFWWADDRLVPLTFRQDGFPQIWQEVVFLEAGKPAKYYPKPYRDLVSFSNYWARNLREQGFLDGEVLQKQESE